MNVRKRAKEMAVHAYKTVPLYYHIAEKDGLDVEQRIFEELPVVDKSYYVGSGMSCLSSKYIGDYIGKRLQWTRTSGSTGKFTEVYWKPEEDRKSLLSLWIYRRKYYGITAVDKMCYFFPSDIGENVYFEGEYFLGISRKCIYDGRLEKVYDKIIQYAPTWMILQPSLAMLLCDVAEKWGKKPDSLRYIELTGEYLEPVMRERIQKVFSCKIANQYGTKEVNSIAYECPEGNMHCMSDNVYIEICNKSIDGRTESYIEEEGEICVTTLQNYAMPLIRFRLEDRGKIHRNVRCLCGRQGDVLELYAGRANDWITTKDGGKVHPYTLMQVIHQLNCQTDGVVIQYQIIQKDYETFTVTVVIEEKGFFDEIAEYISEGFRDRLEENIEVTVELADRLLPEEQTGKLAAFISKL